MSFATDAVSATAWAVRVREGDFEKQQALTEYLRDVLFRRFIQLGVDMESATELTQECLFEVVANLSRFDESRSNIVTWVSGFVRTSVKSWKRREYSRTANELPIDEYNEYSVELESLSDVDCAVRNCLGGLNAIDQELLTMRFSLNLSFEEIAVQTDLTEANCRKRVSRAIDRLRRDPELREALGL